MKKYAIPAALLLLGNELVSLFALCVISVIFLTELLKGAAQL